MINKAYKIVLFGPPASGKGTQSEFLSDKLNLPEISMGDLLRDEISAGSQLGRQVEGLLAKGSLVSDEAVNLLLQKRLRQPEISQGFILDGYPRKVSQATFLDTLVDIDYAIEINISDVEAISRIAGRRICSQCDESFHLKYNPPRIENICDKCGGQLIVRGDDSEKVIKDRLKLYHELTFPLVKFYLDQNKYLKINGEQSIPEVSQEILKKLKIK